MLCANSARLGQMIGFTMCCFNIVYTSTLHNVRH